eukprot:TRINITY_DN23865_c0_g2_i2.p1 TRINITY_DN23865_c0_g2~~TRINITY_DN23865_c0_g2_i2.p1  ORF type:complete len:1066 (+),score=249.23 TRINITY_DN23865_c0_g2_i2:140-3337(+)
MASAAVMQQSIDAVPTLQADVVEDADNGQVSLWVEGITVFSFLAGFALWRLFGAPSRRSKKPKKGTKTAGRDRATSRDAGDRCFLTKSMEADIDAEKYDAALNTWRKEQERTLSSGHALRLAARALLQVSPATLVEEIVGHLERHSEAHKPQIGPLLAAVFDGVSRHCSPENLRDVVEASTRRLGLSLTIAMHETIIGGYAFMARNDLVASHAALMEKDNVKLTARARQLLFRGFLRNRMSDEALQQVQEMATCGEAIPAFAHGELARCLCESGRAQDLFELPRSVLAPQPEGAASLFEFCLKVDDVALLKRGLEFFKEEKVPLNLRAYDAALKLLAQAGDMLAPTLFEQMQASDCQVSEGLCVGLLARSAEPKFLRFAELVYKYAKANLKMSVNLYSALMKVYAFCGDYNAACDLYESLKQDGLEPDQMMYNCLMKFSAVAGRAELSRQLCTKVDTLDMQNYMAMIRAAGQERNVPRAIEVLGMMKAAGQTPDTAAYNCVLDVCAKASDTDRLQKILKEMNEANVPRDMITFNTLLNGCAFNKDLDGAKALLIEMEKQGFPPNDVSYNVIINMAVSSGRIVDAWDTIETMDSKGVRLDQYTVSTMLKAVKTQGSAKDVRRIFSLLDKTGLSITTDEVLFNVVVEACVRHREFGRLRAVLQEFQKSNMKPAVHTYGMLIRAWSQLKRVGQCKEYWTEMVDHRGLQPNAIVLGCMLDALSCNECADEALVVFEKWRPHVKPNSVMYSTLLKGLVSDSSPMRVNRVLELMSKDAIAMNTSLYNLLIDFRARAGMVDEVVSLRRRMIKDGCESDDYTVSLTIKAYCVGGRLEEALKEFKALDLQCMGERGVVIFNTLLDGCIRNEEYVMFDNLLKNMDSYGVVPSAFTLSTVIKCYGRRRQLKKAFETVDLFPSKYGVEVTVPSWMCLLSACALCDDLESAMKVFGNMRAADIQPTSKAYKVLIPLAARSNAVDTALQLTKEAYGLTPKSKWVGLEREEANVLGRLMRQLRRVGKLQSVGMPLLEELRAAGVNTADVMADLEGPPGGDSRQRQQRGGQNGYHQQQRRY